MQTMHYLTVQDFLWISQEIAKRVQKYQFATLEEAVNSQYSLGSSQDHAEQAARLLRTFPRLHPFETANDAVAFVGTLAFLGACHKKARVSGSESLAWVRGLWASPSGAKAEIESRLEDVHPHGVHGLASVRQMAAEILVEHRETIEALLKEEPARALAAK